MGITIGLLIPLLGTMLGAAFVFFMKKDMSPRLQKSLLGFASGVMVAASVWSLLIPSIEMETGRGAWRSGSGAFSIMAHPYPALHALIRRRRNVLRGCRRTNSRSLFR